MANQQLYTSGPFRGLPTNHTSPTWLAEYFLNKARQLDKKANNQDKYIEYFEKELEGDDSQEWYEMLYDELQNKKVHRPPLAVSDHDMPRLQTALEKFLEANDLRKPTHINDKDSQYLLYWLIKNLTNSDCEDLVSYVNRYTTFTLDNTFDNLNNPIKLGSINGINFYTNNVEEYESGLETPYLFLFWAEDENGTVVLPFIRYGIEHTPSGNVAYVYAIQRRIVKKSHLEKQLDRIFAKVNSGIKDFRNISPSMLCVLSTFVGLLKAKSITKLKAPDYIVRRFGSFWGSENDETDARIQASATDKFLIHFLRLDSQFEGVDLQAYPNDIDSFMHLNLSPNISTNNAVLHAFFSMGEMAGNKISSEKYLDKIPNALTPPDEHNV